MMNNGLCAIHNYPNAGEIFDEISVAVSHFVINKQNKNNETHYIETSGGKEISNYHGDFAKIGCIMPSKEAYNILEKIKSKGMIPFKEKILGKMAFGINSNGRLGATGTSPYIECNKEKSDKYNTGIIFLSGREPYIMYASKDYIRNAELIKLYKVACGHVINKNANCITNINIVNPEYVTSGSYAILYYTDNKQEAENVVKYAKTQFFRLLIYISIDTKCDIIKSRFELVPLQDFTNQSDIDWSQSIADIDKQLYKKYNLTDEEINYIEKTIKPMN